MGTISRTLLLFVILNCLIAYKKKKKKMEGRERTCKHSSSQNLKLINFRPLNKGPGNGKAN